MVTEALRLNRMGANVYFTLNPINPGVAFGRDDPNRVLAAGHGALAKDSDILRRRWLFIDADPIRPTDTSATDGEKVVAFELANDILAYLAGRDWPAPVMADSGNGYHLLYDVDLPADDDGLVERVRKALAARFSTEAVKIDTNVYNPSRICRFYGTVTRKGDPTPARPHRQSRVIHVPDRLVPVPGGLIEELAAEVRPSAASPRPSQYAVVASATPACDREEVAKRAIAYLQACPPAIRRRHRQRSQAPGEDLLARTPSPVGRCRLPAQQQEESGVRGSPRSPAAAAAEAAQGLRARARRVYPHLANPARVRQRQDEAAVLEWVHRNRSKIRPEDQKGKKPANAFSWRMVRHDLRRRFADREDDLRRALQTLEEKGHVKETAKPREGKTGRNPQPDYFVNPKSWDQMDRKDQNYQGDVQAGLIDPFGPIGPMPGTREGVEEVGSSPSVDARKVDELDHKDRNAHDSELFNPYTPPAV